MPDQRTFKQDLWQLFGQLPAGATLPLANSSTRPTAGLPAAPTGASMIAQGLATGDYRPAALDMPGSIYGLIKGAATGDFSGGEGYLGQALPRVAAANERNNEFYGIDNPHNVPEMAMNIVGSIAVPSPIKAPFSGATTTAGKVAQGAGNIATEFAFPMRQTPMGTALPATLALGLGIPEAIDAALPSDDYQSIADTLLGKHPDVIALGKLTPEQITANAEQMFLNGASMEEVAKYAADNGGHLEGLEGAYQNKARDIATGKWKFTDPKPLPFQPEVLESPEKQESDWQKRLAVAGTVLASAVVGTKYALNGIKAYRSLPNPPSPTSLVGQRTIRPMATPAQRATTAILQADEPARVAIGTVVGPDAAKQYGYKADRVVAQALGTKIESAINTGNMPGSVVTQNVPLAPLLEGFAKELNPQQQETAVNALLAATSLDDRLRLGNGVRPSFTDLSDDQLRTMVTAGQSDPAVAKYVTEVKNQYKGLLQYAHEQGLISTADYHKMRRESPNYVHLSRDQVRVGELDTVGIEGYTGANAIDQLIGRSTEHGGGVQTGAVRSPIDELPARYAQIIRTAQLNGLKRDYFNDMIAAGADKITITASDGKHIKLIQELTDTPKSVEGVHTIYDGGRKRNYKVGDPALDTALKYMPRQTAGVLGTMRNIAQQFVTGVFEPKFAATVSPVYDTMAGMLLRPAGTSIGIINEMLNKTIGVNIGLLDPSALLTAPIGAVRHMKDGLTGSLAETLTEQIMRQDGTLFNILGPQRASAIRDVAQKAYENSIRSLMESEGISSHAYSSDTARGLPIGLHSASPTFFKQATSRARDAALAGNPSLIEGMLVRSQSGFAKIKASQLARLYTGAIRSMQEGFRYQYLATNLPRTKNLQELDKLASLARRISVDSAQHGYGTSPAGKLFNQLADSSMYTNIAVQAFGQLGRAIKNDPVNFTANALALGTTLLALRYGSMINDPEALKANLERTDIQKASGFTIAGGIELPMDPLARIYMGPVFATLDQMMMQRQPDGSMAFDPSFVAAINSYFEGDDPREQNERVGQAGATALQAAAEANVPFLPNSFPAANMMLSAAGLDIGMTRATGDPALIRPQQESPLAGEGRMENSLISAQTDAMLQATLGSSITSIVHAADEMQRALYTPRSEREQQTSIADAFQRGMSRFKDDQFKMKTPVRGMVFGNYEGLAPYNDTNITILRDKTGGIDQINKIFRSDIAGAGLTNAPGNKYTAEEPADYIPPEYVNTQLAPIGVITKGLQSNLARIDSILSPIKSSINDYKTGMIKGSIEDENKEINKLNDLRRYWEMRKLMLIEQSEEHIRQTIGDPTFRYNKFNPQKYSKPLQPQP